MVSENRIKTNENIILSENEFLIIKLTSYYHSGPASKGGIVGAFAGMYQDKH